MSEYFAYGARIVSDQPIPELDGTRGGDGLPELRIRFNGPTFVDLDVFRGGQVELQQL